MNVAYYFRAYDENENEKIIIDSVPLRGENTEMKNAIIYTRGHNKLEQKEICERYAAANGYTAVKITDDLKDVFQTMEDYEFVIVADKTRIARRLETYIGILTVFNEIGVTVVAVTE